MVKVLFVAIFRGMGLMMVNETLMRGADPQHEFSGAKLSKKKVETGGCLINYPPF
jgi:hypothetical protein